MASNLRVDTILPSTGTSLGIGTASGTTTVTNNLSVTNNLTATGSVNAASATITGNLGVGGVLTYEDVTNIDSVGVITARDGLRVTGIATATSFVGLTNTDGTTDIITLHADADGTNNGVASIKLMGNAGNHAAFIKGGHTTNGDTILTFHTDAHDSGINPEERLRITSAGDLLLGGHSAYTYDDTGSSNVILDIYGGATAGKRGILSLSGRVGSNDGDLGTIWFNNDNNSGASPGNNMKLAAAIQAKSVTSDSNAQNDSGAYLQFFTKAESGPVTETLRISSQGYVTKSAHPSFYARRSIAGDGRAGSSSSAITEWTNPGSETSGNPNHNRGGHFNHSTGLFTAPVSGIYHFSAAAGYKESSYSFNQKFIHTGVLTAEGVRFIGNPPSSHSTATISATVYMAAGNTMGVAIEYTHHANTTHNFFSGHLVG